MCGIIGSWGKFTEEEVCVAAKSIAHRGPDAFASYAHNNVVLAHHRLSILDLTSNGAQPYQFEHLIVVFNGEIYNYQAIRETLISHGYEFTSNSDTEVVIKAFHKWGARAVDSFTGMFAFAIYDKREDCIFLFRDRMGVKPLYYSLENGLTFGSELRAVLPFLTSREIDQSAVYEYFRVGYISRSKTIYKQINKLLPGHYLHYKNRQASIKKYWSIEDAAQALELHSERKWKERVEQLMIDAFSLRMVSDVPVGVFLSGGIDSSLVSSILQKHYGNIHTFTISFNDERYNEAPYARKIAQYLGTNHTEFTLDVADAYDILNKFYDIYDEPFADSSGIPSTVVSKLAAKAGVKVVLSADGGDELFAGYNHYQTSFDLYNKIKGLPSIAKSLAGQSANIAYQSKIFKLFFNGNLEHKTATFKELINSKHLGQFYHAYIANQASSEMSSLLLHPVTETGNDLLREDISGLMFHDLQHYLPDDLLVKMDRATMFNSIEGREPFLDHRLVELSCKMPLDFKIRNGESKWILKEILADYIPREYFIRPKKGFSIPIFRWFSEHLDHLFDEYLSRDKIKATGIFNVDEVMHERKKYNWNRRHGKEANIEKMWRLLSFMMWWEKWHLQL